MSRAQMAELLDVDPSTINKWEDPKLSNLPLQDRESSVRLTQVADVLGVSMRWILHGDELDHDPPPAWAETLISEIRENSEMADKVTGLMDDLRESILRQLREPREDR